MLFFSRYQLQLDLDVGAQTCHRLVATREHHDAEADDAVPAFTLDVEIQLAPEVLCQASR